MFLLCRLFVLLLLFVRLLFCCCFCNRLLCVFCCCCFLPVLALPFFFFFFFLEGGRVPGSGRGGSSRFLVSSHDFNVMDRYRLDARTQCDASVPASVAVR